MPNLVGIGNSQVPINSMLGGLAYQDSVGEINIDKIKARTGDTAKDIFVYDTSKDSDGGAWRHRTQNTSWYNEGVSATRGARKEFPAVAVIVAYNYGLRIYDGDDPNLPMWMEFNGSSGSSSYLDATNPESCAAINGSVYTGGYLGSIEIRFISDDNRFRNTTRQYNKGNISERNSQKGWVNTGGSDVLVNNNVNDVAMTVLPNAPIDASTGLPVPTIAVGTDGGMSVIRDNGTVADLTGFSPVTFVAIEGDVIVGALGGTSTHDFIFKTNIPTGDEAFDAQIIAGSGNYYMNSNSGTTPLLRDLNMTAMTFNPSDTTIYRGGNNGFDIITKTDTVSGTVNNSLIAYVDTDYNSGYMVGDIKGAFLSSTNTTNVTGTYLYLDNFSNNDKGWTFADNGSDGIDSGVMTIANNGSARATDSNALTGVATGTKLLVKFTVTFGGTGQLNLDDDGAGAGVGGNTNLLIASKSGSGTQTFSAIYTKTASDRVRFIRSSGGNFQIDDFEMKILPEDDRSLKNNGLAVYGTITKEPVATGAELVAYTGFSASNYLQQPYNSDLDFGTGNLSIIFWYKLTSTSDPECFVHRGDGGSGTWGSGPIIQIEMDTSHLEMQLANSGFVGFDQVQVPVANSVTGEWQHFVGVRKDGYMHIYIDGVKYGNVASTRDLSNTAATTWIGQRPNASRPLANGSMALLRMSPSAPTEEQVIKMYNDEKHLFQKNAKCTISGATSAVTALGFDDSNNVVHAGTSSGRSDFRGLNRINNTTTAVTTAISASNGLVAEQ